MLLICYGLIGTSTEFQFLAGCSSHHFLKFSFTFTGVLVICGNLALNMALRGKTSIPVLFHRLKGLCSGACSITTETAISPAKGDSGSVNSAAVPVAEPLKAVTDSRTPRDEYFNRNPRNMEMMNLAMKRTGWMLDANKHAYYNKLHFEKTATHIKAYVMHSSGRKVVSASTEEFAISRHLYRNTDASAAENIGRVLARRMLETGILNVHCSYSDEERKSERIKVFLNALTESGIQVGEPERVKLENPFGDMTARHLKSTSIRRHPPRTGAKTKKLVIMPSDED